MIRNIEEALSQKETAHVPQFQPLLELIRTITQSKQLLATLTGRIGTYQQPLLDVIIVI